MPPTREATTGVEQAMASRLMMPNGSYTDGHANHHADGNSPDRNANYDRYTAYGNLDANEHRHAD